MQSQHPKATSVQERSSKWSALVRGYQAGYQAPRRVPWILSVECVGKHSLLVEHVCKPSGTPIFCSLTKQKNTHSEEPADVKETGWSSSFVEHQNLVLERSLLLYISTWASFLGAPQTWLTTQCWGTCWPGESRVRACMCEGCGWKRKGELQTLTSLLHIKASHREKVCGTSSMGKSLKLCLVSHCV
jgi:hypothetical protein